MRRQTLKMVDETIRKEQQKKKETYVSSIQMMKTMKSSAKGGT